MGKFKLFGRRNGRLGKDVAPEAPRNRAPKVTPDWRVKLHVEGDPEFVVNAASMPDAHREAERQHFGEDNIEGFRATADISRVEEAIDDG